MTVVLKNRIFKGPLTGCEYFNDNRALIGNTSSIKKTLFILQPRLFFDFITI